VADGANTLWVAGGEVGRPSGFVWRVREARVEPWVEIPDALFLNGAALHPDGRLLIADSIRGCVYAVDLGARRAQVWLTDERLTSRRAGAPGVNGIKVFAGEVYLSVTDRNLLLRAAITGDGTCGPLRDWAERLRADDFALTNDGTAYVATHPANSVLRLDPDGRRVTLAGPGDGAVGTTAVAVAPASREPGIVYVTTNGGMWLPYGGAVQPAKLLRLEVGNTAAHAHPARVHIARVHENAPR
jgi:sugar lactone lactonase YvrE